jgi:hypothetical protein
VTFASGVISPATDSAGVFVGAVPPDEDGGVFVDEGAAVLLDG